MARQQAAAVSPYEVRCYRCDTSFAPGTRRCVHCGERIGRPPALEMGLAGAEEGEEGMPPTGSPARVGLWALTAVLAMAGSLFRVCQGG